MTTTSIQIPIEHVTAAARALTRALRFDEAAALLDTASGAPDDVDLALARAEVTIAEDWFHSRHTTDDALRDVKRVVDAHGDADAAWDLGFLFVRATYRRQLFPATGHWTGPTEPDAGEIADLRRRAEALRDNAPDDRRRGWAEFKLGLIADNVFGEREAAPERYAEALRCGEKCADDHLLFEALRHLGTHDRDAGDHEQARQRWETSAHHAAKGGLVGSMLAQLLLVAASARDRGDEAGAKLLVTELGRWAAAVGYGRIRDMTEGFANGIDPVKGPEDD